MFNINEILDDVRSETRGDGKRFSIYLSAKVYADFKALCGKLPPSKVLERMMMKAVEQGRGKKKKE